MAEIYIAVHEVIFLILCTTKNQSKVAKEIYTELINVAQDVEKYSQEQLQNITQFNEKQYAVSICKKFQLRIKPKDKFSEKSSVDEFGLCKSQETKVCVVAY